MWLGEWLRPPRHLLALFLAIILAPAVALGWLAWRSFEQDRALENQRVQERLDHAADLAVAALQHNFSRTEEWLIRLAAAPDPQLAAAAEQQASELAGDALLVVLRAGEVEAYPRGRLLYYPVAPASREPATDVFAAGEILEFQQKDYPRAIAAFRELARSGDAGVRAGAWLRLGRCYRKARQADAALASYAELARSGPFSPAGVPAELLAHHARCGVLEEAGRLSELQREAQALDLHLHNGRWQLTRAVYRFYADEAARWLHSQGMPEARQEALALAAAVDSLWEEWQRLRSAESISAGRRSLRVEGRPVLLLWPAPALSAPASLSPARGVSPRLVALVAGRRHLAQPAGAGLRGLQALAERQSVRLVLTDAEGHAVLGDSTAAGQAAWRKAADTQLPWSLGVTSANPGVEATRLAGRRRLLVVGLAMIVLLVVAGGYLIARAVNRELEVARLQSEFVSAVSHEFRTPLASLRQLSELLADGRVPNEQRRQEYYQGLLRAGGRLQRLVEGLLDFGRMEAGVQQYRFRRLNTAAVLRTVAEEFGQEAQERGYRLEIALPDSLPCVRADEEALSRALWNLLDNAVKYSPECKMVWIEACWENSRVAIRVKDKGLGLAPDEQQQVFKKFVRAASAAASGAKGTGIGLAMVQHIVAAHGGEIRLESQPGVGSTFTILLPGVTSDK